MKFIFRSAVVAISGLSSVAFALDCANPQTTVDQLECAVLDYRNADRELNDLWPEVLSHFNRVDESTRLLPGASQLRSTRDLIIDAQLAWIELRDNDAFAIAEQFSGGSLYNIVLTQIKTDRTLARMTQLERLMEGPDTEIADQVSAQYAELEASTPSCKNDGTTVAWKICVGDISKKADKELNLHYRIAREVLRDSDSERAVEKLTSAQLAWIKMRDADCQASTRVYFGGSAFSGISAMCFSMETIERTLAIRGTYRNK
jgi:uncharacterized protein YecT (DUF1311 family)